MALENFLGISNEKLITSFAETLYMVGISLIIATVIAFILAVVLIFTRKGGLYPNADCPACGLNILRQAARTKRSTQIYSRMNK